MENETSQHGFTLQGKAIRDAVVQFLLFSSSFILSNLCKFVFQKTASHRRIEFHLS